MQHTGIETVNYRFRLAAVRGDGVPVFGGKELSPTGNLNRECGDSACQWCGVAVWWQPPPQPLQPSIPLLR